MALKQPLQIVFRRNARHTAEILNPNSVRTKPRISGAVIVQNTNGSTSSGFETPRGGIEIANFEVL